MRRVSLTDIRNALKGEALRAMQVIHLALMAGVTGFFLVVVFIYFTGPGESAAPEGDLDLIDLLTIVHGFTFIACLVASNFLKKKLYGRERVESAHAAAGSEGSPAGDYLALIRTVKIITAALLEAPAFFGLTVCFIAVTRGVMAEHSFYWINTISYFAFILILARDFPTRERIENLFNTELKYLVG